MVAALGACVPATGTGDPSLVADSTFPPAARPVRSSLALAVVSDAARDRADEARRVAELLRLTPGQRIAELEAGTGYFALRFARALGPASPIVAVDSDPAAASYIEARAAERGLFSVRGALSTGSDPRLAPNAADIALIGDAYATIAEPYAYFSRLAAGLPAGGRLAVVGLDQDIQLGGMPLALVRCELEAVGYEMEIEYRLVPVDRYLAVFIPPEEPVRASEIRACRSDGSRAGVGR